MEKKRVVTTQRVYQKFGAVVGQFENIKMDMVYTPQQALLIIQNSTVTQTFELHPPSTMEQELYRVYVHTEATEGEKDRLFFLGEFVDFPQVLGVCMGFASEAFSRFGESINEQYNNVQRNTPRPG
jgi:hypothetical protein